MTRRNGRLGRKYNRASTRAPSRGLGVQPSRDGSSIWEKHLHSFNYNINHPNLYFNFKRDYNEVVKSGMIQGTPVVNSNAMNTATEKAIHAAYLFMQNKPKVWKHYVTKAKAINNT